MIRVEVSEADLLRAFAALPDIQIDLAAEAMGFGRDPAAITKTTKTTKTIDQRSKHRDQAGSGRQTRKPKPGTELTPPTETPYFWRLASDLPTHGRSTTAPAWLASQAAIDDAGVESTTTAALAALPLTSAHRFASFIRRHLAVAMRSAEPDTQVAVQRLARGESLAACPALIRRRWPGGVHLVIDASPQLWPLAFDLGVLADALERLLGQRLRLFRSAGLPGALLDAEMRPATLPADGAPVVVLGDAGLLALDARRQRAWAAWGQRQQRAGRRALLLAPVPAPTVTLKMAEAFDVVPLGQAGGLRWLTGGVTGGVAGSVTGSGLAAATPTLVADQPLPPSQALLRDLLFGNSYVEPSLLRRLRRLLQARGHALAVDAEVAVWRHTSVIADPGGCTLHPSQRDAVQQRLAGIDPGLLLAALAEHWEALRAASPLVRSEFAQWWHGLLQQRNETGPWQAVIAQALTEGQQLMRGIAAGLWALPAERSSGLAAYLRRFGRRSPLLLGASDGLQVAWTLAQREAISGGAVALPGAVDLALVGWVFGDEAAGPAMRLLVQAEAQAGSAQRASLRWTPDAALPGISLCDGVAVGRIWSAQSEPAAGQRSLRWVAALMLTLHARLHARLRRLPSKAGIAALIEEWLSSVALAAGGIDPPMQARQRPAQLYEARTGLAALMAQPATNDIGLERLVHELLAWINAHRPNRRATVSDPDDLPSLLFSVLADDELEAVVGLAETQPVTRQHLQRDVVLGLSPEARCTLALTDRTLVVEAIHRPPWAEAVWHDQGRLMAALADDRRLVWVAAASWRLVEASEGDAYRLPEACWWDELEFSSFFREGQPVLRRPSWASRHGVDSYGYWAEFEVQRIVQRMCFIPPGRFWMGSRLAEQGPLVEETLHAVTLTRGFWLADTACTQALWQAVTGELPKGQRGTGANLPVAQISPADISQRFLLQLQSHLPGFDGRLPSEAEWEYAARAGTTTAFSWGDKASFEQMNFGKSKSGPLPVKAFPANPWGLHQMHGNVFEWCADGQRTYPLGEVVNPPRAEPSARRVLRGGAWFSEARHCRSGDRSSLGPGVRDDGIGFRLARGLAEAARAAPERRAAPEVQAQPAAFSDLADQATGSGGGP